MGNIIIVALLMTVTLIGIKPREDRKTALSLEQSNVIKAIAALILVCVHIGNVMDRPGVYSSVLSPFGYLLVSIFFFYSGYGTFLGLKKTGGGYRYVVRQVKKVVKLVVFTEAVYYFVYLAFGKIQFNFATIIKCLSGFQMLAGQMWYMHALIVIYLGMLIVELVLRNTKYRDTIAAIVGILLYFIYIALRGRPFHEIQSCLAFLFGGMVSRYESVQKFIVPTDGKRVKRGVAYCIVLAVSIVTIYGVRYLAKDYYFVRMIFGWTSSISFLSVMCLLLDKIEIGNKILAFVGRYFTWIYLSHTLIISVLYWMKPEWFAGQHNLGVSVAVIGITLMVSVLIGELIAAKRRTEKPV